MRLRGGYPQVFVQMNDVAPATTHSFRQLFRIIENLRDLFIKAINANGGPTMLDIARGEIPGLSGVNKFGRSTNVDLGIDTDIHDGANSTDDVAIWVAPEAAVKHNIVSTHADDDGSPVGDGARTIEVYGLVDWDTKETSETVTMNGTTDVLTTNLYVIIHRMKVLTKGVTDVNVGVITATTDNVAATVTAQINAGEGQTQMAIYGIPSIQTAYMTAYYASAIKRTGVSVSMSLLIDTDPDTEILNYLIKHTQGLVTDGTNYLRHVYEPPFKISGPAIIKMQANSSANDTDVSAGFDLVLEDN